MNTRNSILISFVLIIFFNTPLCAEHTKALTYNFSGGRFGDNVLSYMHAKYFSYKYKIPLLYKNFPYSNQLMLDMLEERFDQFAQWETTVTIHNNNEAIDLMAQSVNCSTLFVIPYCPELIRNYCTDYFVIDWDDIQFKKELQTMIAPIQQYEMLPLPSDRINVAVHVRKGGAFEDGSYLEKADPLKLPGEAYYLKQIQALYELLDQTPLYIHLFTDDSNPGELLQRFAYSCAGRDIQFNTRFYGNSYAHNVLEDFFGFLQFDCFIHGQSNFALSASKIGDFMVDIEAQAFSWIQEKPEITQVKTTVNRNCIPDRFKTKLSTIDIFK